MDRLINTVMRRVVRHLVNRGIAAGTDAASRTGDGRQTSPKDTDTARRTRQTARMMRRLTRF